LSVHGEFERYLDATLHALRESGQARLVAWSDEIESQASSSTIPLDERARRVLDGPLEDASDLDGIPGLADAVAGLLAISRIILGR
jgi:hypothetical protein